MKINFFSKMAWRNIQSNRQLYVPYVFSSVLTVTMFMLMASLMTNEFVRERSTSLTQLFAMGVFVIGLFSLIFIFYTNNFLMKRRKKELGIYSILGLEKKHVARVITFEMLIVSSFSIIVGILVGILFGQLVFLFLNYLLQMPTLMEFSFSLETIIWTVGLFIFIFLLTLLYNIAQITFSNPIKLLKGAKQGEKEPKSSPLLCIIGLVSLGAGYWMSVSIEDPVSALMQFFLATLLVIIGTYLLFNAGSVIVLKALKKNKTFYYQPGPFISISGMLYRMKQHATGLANISILSVMVIVALSTTLTLFLGTEEMLTNRFPEENSVTIHTPSGMPGEELKKQMAQLEQKITEETLTTEFTIGNQIGYRLINFWGSLNENVFELKEMEMGGDRPTLLTIIPLEDFNETAQTNYTLAENELLMRTVGFDYKADDFRLANHSFNVKALEELPFFLDANIFLAETLIVIAPSVEIVDTIVANYAEETEFGELNWQAELGWSADGPDEYREKYANKMLALSQEHDLDIGVFYESRDGSREEWYSMNGGFLFLGIFLGGLFTIGSVLITYFKQVSEGYDDRERIQIMQKVGLDKITTRKATRYQILWMFSLPLLVAIMHTIFAYPILQKMLVLFGITSSKLFILSITTVIFIYGIIYWVIYRVTSKIYLDIVE